MLKGSHEERVKRFGVGVNERENLLECAELKYMLTQARRFWSNEKDIQSLVV